MAERTDQETQETTDSGAEEPEASSNGDAPPSGTVSTGLALTIGGAVVGALLALLHRRRATEEDGPDGGPGSRLADDLVARASAAAKGGGSQEDDDESDERQESADEGDASPVGVTQASQPDGAASADREDGGESEHEGSDPRGEATSAPEHQGTRHDEDAEPEADATRREEPASDGAERPAAEHESPETGAESADDGAFAHDGDGHGSGALGAARAAARQLAELTGRTPEAVLGVERGDGGWRVTVEVVEVSRTPPTTDVLGSYEVELDGDCELVEYHQVGRYVRGRAAEGG